MATLVSFQQAQTQLVENNKSWASKTMETGGRVNMAMDGIYTIEGTGNNMSTYSVWSTDGHHAIPETNQQTHFPGSNGHSNVEMLNDVVVQNNKDIMKLQQTVTVSWKDITLSTKKGKDILKDLEGKVKPGELTAIMGPSGAGKTSLLSVLAGFTKQKYSGKVTVNGGEREMNTFRNLSCYVVQDSNLFDYLTVRECVTLAAALKLPSTISKIEKQVLADKVIESLNLTEVRDSRTVKLSGGERKRVCIAQEIVSNPHLIFLDEPTSGLDSMSCFQCIKVLKELANEGRTVVCTIHQPNARIFEMFDKLYLMANGQCMYRGSTEKLVKFLGEQGFSCPQYHNPADFAMEVITGVHGDCTQKLKEAAAELNDDEDEDFVDKSITIPARKIESTLEASTMNLVPPQDKKNKKKAMLLKSSEERRRDYTTGMWNQFCVLLYRNFISTIRNPMITHLQIFMYAASSLFIGALFNGIGNDAAKMHENAGFMFFATTFNFFMVQTTTVMTFPLERIVIAKEHMNNWYSPKAYFLARSVIELPYQIFLPLLFSSIVYWITKQPPDALRFALFTLCTILMYIVAQSLALILGALFPPQSAVFMASAVTVPICIFSGFIVTFKTMPGYLRWMSYLSYARYIFQGITFSLYAMDRTGLDCSGEICMTPKQIMEYFDIDDSGVYVYFGAPLIFIIFFKVLGYYVIRYKMTNTVIR